MPFFITGGSGSLINAAFKVEISVRILSLFHTLVNPTRLRRNKAAPAKTSEVKFAFRLDDNLELGDAQSLRALSGLHFNPYRNDCIRSDEEDMLKLP